jgi:FkbM family methyltransferase
LEERSQIAALRSGNRLIVQPPSLRTGAYLAAVRAAGAVSRRLNFKGLWHTAKHLGPLIGPDPVCSVATGQDSRFAFQCSDPYWARLIARSFVYEVEIRDALTLLRGVDFAFLDCGSNLGYWSVFCSDAAIGCQQVLAVEASATTFPLLERNRRLNNDRFRTLHRAIFSRSGEIVRIHQPGSDHASAGIGETGMEVETTTIDDLAAAMRSCALLVIKLDVEGVEIPAFEGASQALKGPAVVMFEDHGSDPTSKVCRFVMDTLALDVFAHDGDGGFVRLRSADEASALKTNPKKGYNFFAVTPAARGLFPMRS